MATPGTIGPYEILAELGRGGMGIVYRARQPSLDREVALKVVRLDDHPASDLMRSRMKRETRILMRLQHPNLVRLLDGNWANDPPYVVFELLPGSKDLVKFLEAGQLDRDTAKSWIVQIARGLDYLHREGVIHRDVKPGNVLIDHAGVPRIIDFGLSRHTTAADTRLTRDGETVGSLPYMAPEQLSCPDVDTRADVYSFGLLAYELLAGRFVFGGRGVPEVMLAQRIAGYFPPIEQAAPGLEPQWCRALARCHVSEVEKRTPSMARFLEQIGADALPAPAPLEESALMRLAGVPPHDDPTAPLTRSGLAAATAAPVPAAPPDATIPGGNPLELAVSSGSGRSSPTPSDASPAAVPRSDSRPPGSAGDRVPLSVILGSAAVGLVVACFVMVWSGPATDPVAATVPSPAPAVASTAPRIDPLVRLEAAADRLARSPRASLKTLKEAIQRPDPTTAVWEVLAQWGLRDLLDTPMLGPGSDEPATTASLRRDEALLEMAYLDVFARTHELAWPLGRPVEEMLSPRFRQQFVVPQTEGWTLQGFTKQGACVHEERSVEIPFEVSAPGEIDAAMICCSGLNLHPEFVIWLELNERHRFSLSSTKVPPFRPPNPVEVADRAALAAAGKMEPYMIWRALDTLEKLDCVGLIARGIPPGWLVAGTNKLSVHIFEVLGKRHINGPSVWRFGLAAKRRTRTGSAALQASPSPAPVVSH